MLEQFKITDDKAIRVSELSLRNTVTEVFTKMGLHLEDCRLAADVLVMADLRGVDTHGVSDTLADYVEGYGTGTINANPDWRIIRESPATASIDCDRGLGIVVAPKAMEIAIEKARRMGVCVVTMKNGRHLGMASYHAMLALKHDMIGMCMTTCPPGVLPTFGAEPRLGTNPIAIAAPSRFEAPFVFDAAMSSIAANKMRLSRRLDIRLEPGWMADEDGIPIMEEKELPQFGPDGFPLAALLPLGGTREMGSHKGYGLLAMVDVLSGILTGGGYSVKAGSSNFNHYVAAYNVESFMDIDEFKQTMDEWLHMLKTTKPVPGCDRVFYPGLSESETERDRRERGIPLHRDVVDWFEQLSKELSISSILDG